MNLRKLIKRILTEDEKKTKVERTPEDFINKIKDDVFLTKRSNSIILNYAPLGIPEEIIIYDKKSNKVKVPTSKFKKKLDFFFQSDEDKLNIIKQLLKDKLPNDRKIEKSTLQESIINEGRYSEPVRHITRDVMKEIMSFLEDEDSDTLEWKEEYEQQSFEYEDEDEDYEIYEVRLNVEKIDSDEPYDIDAVHDWDEDESVEMIELNIKINPNLFNNRIINKFQAELKDTIRHETEHLYQAVNPNKSVEFTDYDNFVDEVLSPRELPAYIQGFYTQAKNRKMYMDDIIDEWADDRTKQFDSIEDKQYVKSELKKFGKKLLPQAKWR